MAGTYLLLYVARRILQAIPLIFIIVIINFFLIHSAPGDPLLVLTGQMETTE